MTRIKTQAVKCNVARLGAALSELVLPYRDPANAADFAQHQAALYTALTKHQLLCTALECSAGQIRNRRKEEGTSQLIGKLRQAQQPSETNRVMRRPPNGALPFDLTSTTLADFCD